MNHHLSGLTRCMFVSLSMFLSSITYTTAATAAPVSFSFTAVPLVDFAQATYRGQLGRDFVLSSDLVTMSKKVTISVKALDESKVPSFIDQVLLSQGVRVVERNGVFFMDVAPSADAGVEQTTSTVKLQDSHPARLSVDSSPAGALLPSRSLSTGESSDVRSDDEIKVISVQHRPVDFMLAVVNGVIGVPVAKVGGGSLLVVSAPKDKIQRVLDLIEQLDVASPVVEVSASFVEVTRSTSDASGLSLVAGALSSKLGLSVTPSQGRISLMAGRYQLVLDALASDGRFKQVSNSRVVGDDAQHLALSVGDETPTVGSTSSDRLGNPVQSIVYRSSGVLLDVTPRVLGSGRLSLVVDGQVSSFQATTNGVSNSPTLVKRQVKTGVSLADGEVLVIGGLDDSKVANSAAGFSFLPAWKTRLGNDSKTDLVLILSARVLPQVDQIASK